MVKEVCSPVSRPGSKVGSNQPGHPEPSAARAVLVARSSIVFPRNLVMPAFRSVAMPKNLLRSQSLARARKSKSLRCANLGNVPGVL
jgi:hypothetical protein